PALLQGQAGLSAIEGLALALLVKAEHDRMGRRIDIEADDIAQLVDELRIIRQFEPAHPMGLQAVSAPDALDGADADADRLSHHGAGPVSRLTGRLSER